MKFKLFDLYSDYLLSSFSATTATGMSALMDKAISHDQVSRMLNRRRLEPADWWQMVKPSVRACKVRMVSSRLTTALSKSPTPMKSN